MRSKLAVVATMITVFISGCAGKGFNRGEMEARVQSSRPVYSSTSLSVEEIEKLKPQIHLPIKLAVAPPLTTYAKMGGGSGNWSPEEVAEIESWAEPLKKAGVVSDLFIMPSNLLQNCGPKDPDCTRVGVFRAAAARVQPQNAALPQK